MGFINSTNIAPRPRSAKSIGSAPCGIQGHPDADDTSHMVVDNGFVAPERVSDLLFSGLEYINLDSI